MWHHRHNAHMTMKHWLLATLLGAAACTPSLNWREVRLEGSALKTLFPCKPDHGSRQLPVDGAELNVQMTGCEAQGHLLVVVRLPLQSQASPADIKQAQAQWLATTLAHFKATVRDTQPLAVKTAGAATRTVMRVRAQGSDPQGRALQGHMVSLTTPDELAMAVVYAPQINEELSETFFAGLVLP